MKARPILVSVIEAEMRMATKEARENDWRNVAFTLDATPLKPVSRAEFAQATKEAEARLA